MTKKKRGPQIMDIDFPLAKLIIIKKNTYICSKT